MPKSHTVAFTHYATMAEKQCVFLLISAEILKQFTTNVLSEEK